MFGRLKHVMMVMAIVLTIASPAFAHTPPPSFASELDLRAVGAIDESETAEPLPIIPSSTFDDVARIELPPPSIAETLETRTAAILAHDDARALHVFASDSAELASWPLASGDENNINGERKLSLELHRAIEFQALPFSEPATGLVYARARWYDPATGSFLTPDPLGYVDSSNLYAFAGGDPVNRRDPTGEQYDPAAVHRWMQSQVSVAKAYYSSSDSVAVDAMGNTLADIGSGLSTVFNIGTKTGETYVAENGFDDGYSTAMILSAGAGDLGETILAATGLASAGVKTAQTVTQVKTLARIRRELKVANTAERQGELLTQRAMVRRGWELGDDVKIRGRAGAGRGNQGVDQVYERTNVVSPNRTSTVEVKSINRPDLRTDRLGIQQGSEEFNRTRLNRAADPRLSGQNTIQAANRYQAAERAGKLESYKSTYDASKGSVSFSRLVSDPATAGRTILKEIKSWLLW